MRDLDEEDPVDVVAREQGLSFIRLEGTIGCMVNGAGLAMTTMDLIKRAGGQPANFLDIGGGAKARQGRRGHEPDPGRPERAGDPGQHLRRHRARRRGRARPGRGAAPAGAPRADGGAHRGHQRGGGGATSWPRPAIRTSRRRRRSTRRSHASSRSRTRRWPHEHPRRRRHAPRSSRASPGARARSTPSRCRTTARTSSPA